jgi:hypothetical protein
LIPRSTPRCSGVICQHTTAQFMPEQRGVENGK